MQPCWPRNSLTLNRTFCRGGVPWTGKMGTERLKLKFKLNHKRSQEITELCSKISLLIVFWHHLPFEAVPEKDEELSADAGQYWLNTGKDDIWSTTVSDWITDKNTSNINHHINHRAGRAEMRADILYLYSEHYYPMMVCFISSIIRYSLLISFW